MRARTLMQVALTLTALTAAPASTAAQQQPAAEPITFQSHGSTLQARIFRATTPGAHPTVLLFTGIPGNGTDVLGLGKTLSAAGWNAFFYNPRGLHGSQGEYTAARGLEDAATAIAFVRSDGTRLGLDPTRLAAVGYSQGGWVSLIAGERGAPVTCVVAIAPDNLGIGARRVAEGDSAYIALVRGLHGEAARAGGLVAADFQTLAAELRAHEDDFDPIRHAAGLAGTPVLLIGGWRDEGPTLERYIVPLVRALRAAGNTRVTPVTLDDDHGFTATRQELHRIVSAWLGSACGG